MGYTLKTMIANRKNYGGVRTLNSIKYIVIHYTAVDGDRAENNAKYFQTERNPHASAHYFVDDTIVAKSVLDNYIAYSVGGAKYTDCAQTGGGKLYGIATNANSISIEMCDTLKDGTHNVSEKTMENAAALCRELMNKYGIDIDHVIRHFDVNGKHCPAYFMDSKAWESFKNRLRKYQFETDKTYIVTQACYLRKTPGTGSNKVNYSGLSDAVKKKCRKKLGYAVFKKDKTFRLTKVSYVGNDVWGKMKSGYYVPLVYKDKKRVK